MRESVIPIAIAFTAAWAIVWALVLRTVVGVSMLTRPPEDLAARKQRIPQMGMWRYILTYGILGQGFAYGGANRCYDDGP